MPDEDLAERLDALERTVVGDDTRNETEGNHREESDVTAAGDLERRVTDLESTVEELEAAVQAVRGYAGNVRAVNRDVERRASAALAKAEALEAAVGPARTGASGHSAEGTAARPGRDRDLSREPTVIADSDPDAAAVDDPEPSDTDDSAGSEAAASDDRRREGTETEQFVERVRDAL